MPQPPLPRHFIPMRAKEPVSNVIPTSATIAIKKASFFISTLLLLLNKIVMTHSGRLANAGFIGHRTLFFGHHLLRKTL